MTTLSKQEQQFKDKPVLSDRFTAILPRLIEVVEQEYRDMPRPPAHPTHPHRSLLAVAHHSLSALSELTEATR